jgi:hypothetical protein
MRRLTGRNNPAAALWRVAVVCVGALTAASAAVIAAVLAVFFAATVVVAAFMASILLALTAAMVRGRRQVRASMRGSDVIEARNVGGHSWVAYGWDSRR